MPMGPMECPQCQHVAPSDAVFCPQCGHRLLVVCAGCETPNAATHKFCKQCGLSLGAPAAAPLAPVEPDASTLATRPLVLVADDDPAIRELVSDVLAEAGFRTVRAANGEEVMDLAARQKPVLVVLDVIMPKMDGFTALTRLRGNRATRDIPVIILTGQGGPLYQTLSFGAGATAHVSKPFSPRQLMDTVERVLSGKNPA
jgi:CheY-like chemotaxis protein